MIAANSKCPTVNLDEEVAPKINHHDRVDFSDSKATNKSQAIWVFIVISIFAIGGAYATKRFWVGAPTPSPAEALSLGNVTDKLPAASSLAGPLEPSPPSAPVAAVPKIGTVSTGTMASIATPPTPSATANTLASTTDQAAIHTAIDQLTTDFKSLSGRFDRVEDDLAAIKTTLAEQHTKAASESRQVTRSRSLAKAKQAAAEKPTAPNIGLLSIDTWDGRPSVSVSQGQEIRFVNEGDALGNGYVLKQADSKKQKATFVPQSGD